MKRVDLTVGESYYYNPSSEWQVGRRFNWGRAVVVDDKRYKVNNNSYYARAPYESPKGTCVMVDLYRYTQLDNEPPKPERLAVPVAHLRGPWKQTKAAVDAAVAARETRQRQHREAADRLKASSAALIKAAGQLGVWVADNPRRPGMVSIELEQMDAMLRQLEADGWKCPTREEPSS